MHVGSRHLQGVFPFRGQGLLQPVPVAQELSYTVPPGKQAQLIYFRAGNSCNEMIYLIFMRNGAPMRHIPVGAKSGIHVALALVEDIPSGACLEVFLGAPEDVEGFVMLDIGLAEIGGG